ncbi:MAG: hypothetical protein WAZ14_03965 [Patescibacteria group bacterium]
MNIEQRRGMPDSDVPELAEDSASEDAEVVVSTVEDNEYEELGFDSKAQMEQAKALNAAIVKEQDVAKADQLRAELKALLDDTDGETTGSAMSGKLDTLLTKAAEKAETRGVNPAQPSTHEKVPGLQKRMERGEFEHGLENAAFRVQLDTANDLLNQLKTTKDMAKGDELRRELFEHFETIKKIQAKKDRKQYERSLEPEFSDRAERNTFDANIQQEVVQLAEKFMSGVAELTAGPDIVEPDASPEELEAKQLAEEDAKVKAYEQADTEVFGAGEESGREVA